MNTRDIAAVVLTPADEGYAAETAGYQTGFAVRPALVVGASCPADVRRAVAHAARHGLAVSVRATGHGTRGESTGGLLITTRRMAGVLVDPVARTARISAGTTWGEVVAAAARYGLAPLSGSAPSVGAVGYLLGGGFGLLGRRYGYAADHVTRLDVVTADGTERRLTPGGPDAELFHALLGGGATGLAVVTAVETALLPVARLYGGHIRFGDPSGRTTHTVEEAARRYLAWTRTVPDALTAGLAVLSFPDLPDVPAPLRGRYTATVSVAFDGDPAEGERLVAPLRTAGPVLADTLRELEYADSASIHAEPEEPHPYYGQNALVSELDPEPLTAVVRAAGPGQPVWTVTQVGLLGGALTRPAPNAVPYREAAYSVRLLSPLIGEVDRERARELHRRALEPLGPRTLGRAVNYRFGGGDDTEGLYAPETRERLARVAERYDPGSLFGR